MDLARVVGRVVCTVKDPSLAATTLLIVQPIDPSGGALGKPQVAIDAVGSGAGEPVFTVTGREASFAFLPASVVADVSIVGIVDTISVDDDRTGATGSEDGALGGHSSRPEEARSAREGPS